MGYQNDYYSTKTAEKAFFLVFHEDYYLVDVN